MDPLQGLTLALGSAWASGINLYATVLVLGLLDSFGIVALPPGLAVLGSNWVLTVAGFLYLAEFFADKIPGVDSLWDVAHTFIRIPAGALLAAGAVGGLELGIPADIATALALLAGGAVAAGTHATKAAGRVVATTSSGPFGGPLVSLAEDVLVVAGVALAVLKPVVFLVAVALFVLLVAWLAPKLWRGLKRFIGGARHPIRETRLRRSRELPPSA